jgi:O-antigen/teichoic acid export membrane protein
MSRQEKLGTHVNRGLAWVGVASSLVGLLDFLAILIILGFWVPADQYGIATKAVWIFPILDTATDLGLSAAVIQRDDTDEDTISSVFWINLFIALVLFGALALTAPLVATHFYGEAIVGWMLIAYGTKLIWQNIYFIPSALMKKELRFKELSIIRIIANVAEFAGKVGFAAAGFGIWCFVLGPLCRVLVTGVGAQLRYPWRPRFVLQLRRVWEHAKFGMKSSGSQILFYFYTNVDYPIVGYFFGNAALGVYKLAYEVVLEPVRVISNVVVDIAFPTFSRLRYAREQLVAQFVTFTRLNLVTVMTYSAVVFVVVDDLLALFFPGYGAAATAVRILCVVAVLRSVSFVVPPLLDGMGFPTRTFVYTLTAAVTLPLAYVAGAVLLGPQLGFLSVAVAWAVGYPIAFAVLVLLALYTLQLPARRFLAQVAGVPACMIAATALGLLVEHLARPLPLVVRLCGAIAVVIATIALLLAYTQGLSLRTAARALKGGGNDA